MIWLIVAGVLAAVEAVSLDLVLIMVAGGAAGASVAAGLGAPVSVQALVLAVVSVLLLVGVRPTAKRHLTRQGEHVTGTEALVGRQAVVLAPVDRDGGRVRLGGQEWSARTYIDGEVLPPGTTVRVMQISGATAVVWQEP